MRRFLAAAACLCACTAEPQFRVVPAQGRQTGGEPVRIEGRGFSGHGAPVVYFGVHAAKAVVLEGPRLVRAVTPQNTEAPITVDVTVLFTDGTEVVFPQAFSYSEDAGVVLRPEIVNPP